ncbi:hypothetical protein A8C56_14805 [Niabella ginsenosidivorans]|uniref:Diacylglycerol kinase n=1 Tax=Niabella ginsenosidivorans TaxID=1176587 RepID=A0A1A9IB27_9BACT|nr:diacylglycerol kinase family protein [Niabella ginsenosidivorans]ANH83960.1 hypothetical protein A8C56_14805 [Niabella ginsenosidivorans]
MNNSFSIKKLVKSFSYAFSGLKAVIQSEQNFRVHLVAAFFALLLGIVLKVSGSELLVIVLCIAAVMATELVNTAIEKLCDFVSPEKRATIKIIKDLSAAAVLIVSAGALIAGLIIFIPRVLLLL